ncbi:unnamed protein product [Rangifer tarandus platyrhynchus]|uniref:Uncharacterized protein n=1 Tax=Rangifer tarandus platyrhynchus TaxID=3082113 RepID=A0AC60A3A2_RANTA
MATAAGRGFLRCCRLPRRGCRDTQGTHNELWAALWKLPKGAGVPCGAQQLCGGRMLHCPWPLGAVAKMNAGVSFSHPQKSQSEVKPCLGPWGDPGGGEGSWRLRPPAGPRQLVCEGPTARLLSPAPTFRLSAALFPHSQEPLAVCPPRPGSPPPTALLVLLQRPHLPQRAPSLSCWDGLLSGPRPLRHSLFPPRPLLFTKGPGAAAPVTSAQSGRGWAGGAPGAAAPTFPWDLLQTDSLASAPIKPELPCCL